MIEVKYKYKEDAREVSLTVKGHAGQAPKGKDIVCAGASMLTCTAALIVETCAHHGDLDGDPIIRLKEGDTEISCKVKDECAFAELMTMLFAITRGYDLLASSYPEYVSFSI